MELKPLDWLFAIALAAIALMVGGSLLLPDVCGVFHDDAIYVITAKAIALNKGYCLINLPGSPLQTKYPILYPAILSVIWKLNPNFPENLLPMKWLNIALGAFAISAGYLYMLRWNYASRLAALGGALLCTFSTWFWYCATLAQSEAPFAALLICALWLLERQIRQSKSNQVSEVFTGMILALPFLCRIIGALLIPTAIWLLYKSQKRLKFTILGMALAAGPWILFVLLSYGAVVNNPAERYYTDYFGWWTSLAQDFVGMVFVNICLVLLQTAVLPFSGLHMWLLPVFGNGYLFAAGLVGLSMWWYVWELKIPDRVLPLFLTLYLALLLVWPGTPGRFFVPFLALMSGLLLAGLFALVKMAFKNQTGVWLSALITVASVLANIVDIEQKIAWDKKYGFPAIPFDRQNTAYWSSYKALLSWLSAHSNTNTVAASEFDTMVALYTGVKCIRPIQNKAIAPSKIDEPLITKSELLRKLNQFKVEYVIGMPLPGYPEEKPLNDLLEAIRKEQPQFLERVYTDADPRFFIDRCNYEASTSAGTKD